MIRILTMKPKLLITHYNLQPSKGFTLVEMILVVALIGIVAGLSVPFLQSFGVSSNLYTHSDTILKTLRKARQQSIVGQNLASWGVYFDTSVNDLIFYQGDSYASRDTSFDLVVDFSEATSFTTDFSDDINFSIFSGLPSVSGVIIMASTYGSEIISISSEGLIQLEE